MTRLGWPLLAAMLLSACASAPPVPGEAPWTSGRLSLRVEADGAQPAQSTSVAFDLRGNGDAGELRLNSPLGTRVATARWAPGLALLVTSEGERRYGNLDALSREALGQDLPLAALPDWLAGRPWPAVPHGGFEGGFEQLGWRVALGRLGEGWIEARRSAPPVVLVRVRLDEVPR